MAVQLTEISYLTRLIGRILHLPDRACVKIFLVMWISRRKTRPAQIVAGGKTPPTFLRTRPGRNDPPCVGEFALLSGIGGRQGDDLPLGRSLPAPRPRSQKLTVVPRRTGLEMRSAGLLRWPPLASLWVVAFAVVALVAWAVVLWAWRTVSPGHEPGRPTPASGGQSRRGPRAWVCLARCWSPGRDTRELRRSQPAELGGSAEDRGPTGHPARVPTGGPTGVRAGLPVKRNATCARRIQRRVDVSPMAYATTNGSPRISESAPASSANVSCCGVSAPHDQHRRDQRAAKPATALREMKRMPRGDDCCQSSPPPGRTPTPASGARSRQGPQPPASA